MNLRPDVKFSVYLFKSVRNISVDYFRNKNREEHLKENLIQKHLDTDNETKLLLKENEFYFQPGEAMKVISAKKQVSI